MADPSRCSFAGREGRADDLESAWDRLESLIRRVRKGPRSAAEFNTLEI
ncbi:hypothetical protein SUS17_1060 [Sphingomonas sp. S17]|jgi:hypothetical protein|uniref:Uncharacterized protein n=1 Tax=Sphingomonas paucimobilis TaxID=13689 RepID=A0A7Y2KP10_SPHPI|nr:MULTISPECIES: hypothetical protein [Sphingomonas]MBQ9351658.1 hypothetical protein [Phyllobacterium sp.]EGI56344.1 hypothetical protein SUS17_1060 [Sphingomonas sp. S17]MCM3677886.1 hypothetical protein [Sphingomonas paucimobilis]MDG5972515.1 hypothetical protein [Sphingomonas paucimobilis]NNG57509.1 hypothetical protein [Sphingomonas paucimobilis]